MVVSRVVPLMLNVACPLVLVELLIKEVVIPVAGAAVAVTVFKTLVGVQPAASFSVTVKVVVVTLSAGMVEVEKVAVETDDETAPQAAKAELTPKMASNASAKHPLSARRRACPCRGMESRGLQITGTELSQ